MSLPDVRRPTLLIVDDDPEVLRALAFMTDVRGYQVKCCGSAAEAISAVEPPAGFACLVIDQKLPDRQGVELLQALRLRGVNTPAILITTAPTPALRREAEALGAPIVEKPLLDDALFTGINRLARRVHPQ